MQCAGCARNLNCQTKGKSTKAMEVNSRAVHCVTFGHIIKLFNHTKTTTSSEPDLLVPFLDGSTETGLAAAGSILAHFTTLRAQKHSLMSQYLFTGADIKQKSNGAFYLLLKPI